MATDEQQQRVLEACCCCCCVAITHHWRLPKKPSFPVPAVAVPASLSQSVLCLLPGQTAAAMGGCLL